MNEKAFKNLMIWWKVFESLHKYKKEYHKPNKNNKKLSKLLAYINKHKNISEKIIKDCIKS